MSQMASRTSDRLMTVKEYQQSVEMTRKRKEKTVSDKRDVVDYGSTITMIIIMIMMATRI